MCTCIPARRPLLEGGQSRRLSAAARGNPGDPGAVVAELAGQPCQQCPDQPAPSPMGGPMGGKMALCQMLACVGPLIVLPTMNAIGSRVAYRIAYPAPEPARFAGATPAPDPFPPRPIVLL